MMNQSRVKKHQKRKIQIVSDNPICTFVLQNFGQYNEWRIRSLEVKDVFENFRFETFVDAHSNIFEEYLSSVIAKLSKENPEYRTVSDRIESLYQQYPKVMEVFDTENPSDLSEQECKALIEILELRNKLSDMQQEAIYFRGCYDSVGYLKKAGIL